MIQTIDDCDEDIQEFTSWILQNELWDGRQVSYNEASDFCESAQARILELIQQDATEALALQFAWIGSSDANRALLAREFQHLQVAQDGQIIQAGFGKSLSKFWKKHKTAILIGVAIVAVVTVAIVVAVSVAGTAAGAAAAGATGGKALKKGDKSNEEKTAAAEPPPATPVEAKPAVQAEVSNVMIFEKEGIYFDGKHTTYTELLQQAKLAEALEASQVSKLEPSSVNVPAPTLTTSPKKSWVAEFCESVGKGVIDSPELMDFNAPLPTREFSRTISLEGIGGKSYNRISTINGINNLWEDSLSSAKYIQQMDPRTTLDVVYNKSNGPVVDVAEVFAFNYGGYSPNTANLLLSNWNEHYAKYKNHPGIKYLQICHSQGAIHVKNALKQAPKEIRDHIIVIAIAPGTVVPRELCYDSTNYACSTDFVPKGEVAYGVLNLGNGNVRPLMMALDHREELILLDPLPGNEHGLNHDFQNPVFTEHINRNIKEYTKKNGKYK